MVWLTHHTSGKTLGKTFFSITFYLGTSTIHPIILRIISVSSYQNPADKPRQSSRQEILRPNPHLRFLSRLRRLRNTEGREHPFLPIRTLRINLDNVQDGRLLVLTIISRYSQN